MVQTLVRTAAGPGRAAKGPALQSVGKPTTERHYVMDFDTSNYVVGGESLQGIWDDFNTVLHVDVSQYDTGTAADRREFAVNYTTHTLVVYDAFNTQETASDQTVIKVSLWAKGF